MPNVSIEGKSSSYTLETDELIYDGLDRQGESLPHGCLAGSCGACRIEVLDGIENIKDPSAMEKNTLDSIIENHILENGEGSLDGKHIRLACRARMLEGSIKIKPFR